MQYVRFSGIFLVLVENLVKCLLNFYYLKIKIKFRKFVFIFSVSSAVLNCYQCGPIRNTNILKLWMDLALGNFLDDLYMIDRRGNLYEKKITQILQKMGMVPRRGSNVERL